MSHEAAIENSIHRAFRRYCLELFGAMVGYVAVIAASRSLLAGPLQTTAAWVQVLVAVSPIVPVALMFAAMVRLILHTDEMQRRIYIDALAAAGGITAMLAITYGLIESDRFPRLSAWWTWGVFGISFAVAVLVVRRRYRA